MIMVVSHWMISPCSWGFHAMYQRLQHPWLFWNPPVWLSQAQPSFREDLPMKIAYQWRFSENYVQNLAQKLQEQCLIHSNLKSRSQEKRNIWTGFFHGNREGSHLLIGEFVFFKSRRPENLVEVAAKLPHHEAMVDLWVSPSKYIDVRPNHRWKHILLVASTNQIAALTCMYIYIYTYTYV